MQTYCGNCFNNTLNEQNICTLCGFDGGYNRRLAPHALPAGAILNGRYIIGRILGQGGFGITYTARDHQTGELVAVKEFYPDSMVTRTDLTEVTPFLGERGENFAYGKETFLQEAETMAQFIGNPNIVRVYSYFEENGTAYFVMEYVDGVSYLDYLKQKGGKIGFDDALKILLPVMDALSAVHEKNIIHRDVTPDNIYISKDGTVKLLDFGAARYSLGNASRSLDVILKHGFAPREQYKRRGRQGPFTDVYSLGATLYYSVTGIRPDDALERVDEDLVALPSTLGVTISKEQEAALMKAMALDPENRYQTMAEFRDALMRAKPAAKQAKKPEMPKAPEKQKPVPVRKPKQKKKAGWLIPAAAAMLVCIAGAVFALSGKSASPALSGDPTQTTEPNQTAETQRTVYEEPTPIIENTYPTYTPIHEVSSATIVSAGNLVMHNPIIKASRVDNNYDFEHIFRYITEYVTNADYAVANLETTLASTSNGYPYSGYPNFNCPDEIVDAVKDAGFDMLLNANNHTYDTSSVGAHRTIQIIRDRRLDYIGFQNTSDEKPYLVKDINGIHIGMICYTYETDSRSDYIALGEQLLKDEDKNLVNVFDYNALDVFYDELEDNLIAMQEDGAEATVVYIHWGNEYELTQNNIQSTIAQNLCDLGVDVIVGSHPHVVQPIDLLESTIDPNHKTVCLYSLGNAVSNQRQGNLQIISTAHTEDGVLFSVTFTKYSDGIVQVESADLIPIWVNKNSNNNKEEYNILPLDINLQDQWMTLFGIPEKQFTMAQNSYSRTMDIIGTGLAECQAYLKNNSHRTQY